MLSGYGQASDSEILVTNGGLLRQTGRLLLTEGIASANRKSIAYFTTNRLVVAGKGSSYVGLGSPAVSTGGNGDFILVTDGAYFSGSVHFGIGNKLSTNNLMRVEGGARADITEVRLCASEVDGLAGGRFEILDGAVVSNDNFLVGAYASGAMANGAAGCSLLVSNATFVTKFLSIGQGPAGSNNTVVISGSSAKFDHVTTSASQWTKTRETNLHAIVLGLVNNHRIRLISGVVHTFEYSKLNISGSRVDSVRKRDGLTGSRQFAAPGHLVSDISRGQRKHCGF